MTELKEMCTAHGRDEKKNNSQLRNLRTFPMNFNSVRIKKCEFHFYCIFDGLSTNYEIKIR